MLKRTLSILLFTLILSCQNMSSIKGPPLEVESIVAPFKKLPRSKQTAALQNSWTFYTSIFDFEKFQNDLLKSFPSLEVFGSYPTLIGTTPLDLRPLKAVDGNPVAILLSINLETELLARFHNQTHLNFDCLESFWTRWRLPVPVSLKIQTNEAKVGETKLESPQIDRSPLDESATRLEMFLRQSLGLEKSAKLKLVSNEGEKRAQFIIPSGESYEIFATPVDCKSFKEKKFLVPTIGNLKCLQKQSSTWMTVLASESTVLGDDWLKDTKRRCARWVNPLHEKLQPNFEAVIRKSALPNSWSLYPRIRMWILNEADRYEKAFRKVL